MTRLSSLLLLATAACWAAEPGFAPLFDGTSLAGWSVLPRENGDGRWIVTDSVLTVEGRPGSLATDGQYGDFDLRLEWKIAPLGNTGVFYRVPETGNPVNDAIEYQVADNERPASRKHPDRRCGAAYGLYTPTEDAARPPGEWNALRILAHGPQVEHWLNGRKVASFEIGSEDFLRRVAASKFAKHPAFAKARLGRIVLQDHGGRVAFRNVRIRTLD